MAASTVQHEQRFDNLEVENHVQRIQMALSRKPGVSLHENGILSWKALALKAKMACRRSKKDRDSDSESCSPDDGSSSSSESDPDLRKHNLA